MKKRFFTLAETMIVLAVIGVIAAITVPALVNNHVNSANRTKLKKAMTVYDTALNKMVIENGIKSNSALYEDANSFAPEGNCTNTAPYFKTSQTLNGNICTFKAPDGLYWDISKINEPIIAFKEADLNDETSENRFQLVGHFDNATGSLRVNDLQYESGDNKEVLVKVYSFVNGEKAKKEQDYSCDEICLKTKTYRDKPCIVNRPQNECTSPSHSPWCFSGAYELKSCSVIHPVFEDGTRWIDIYNEKGSYITYKGCDSTGLNCTDCYDWGFSDIKCEKTSNGYYGPSSSGHVEISGSGSGFYSGSGSGSGYGS